MLRLEIGRKLDINDGSAFGFLRIGVTVAFLNEQGKMPSLKDKLARFEIMWEKRAGKERRTGEGMTSQGESLTVVWRMRLLTSNGVTGSNVEKEGQ